MNQEFVATRLDVKAFAQAAGEMAGPDLLSKYERLMVETKGLGANVAVNWSARGELRAGLGEPEQGWLHLTVDTCLPLTCQRCLGPVDVPVTVGRSFRFVADEAAAEAQDEEAEEDVLALSHDFDLQNLIEDEVLMALPLVPLHEVCPVAVKLAVADPDFDAQSVEKPNPFAVLAKLKSGNSS